MAKFVDVGSVASYFESLSDPRHTRNLQHPLLDYCIDEQDDVPEGVKQARR